MASTSLDVTLMSFPAVDVREIKVGDVVIFRTESKTHSRDLPLRHGRNARVVGFSRSSRTGTNRIDVRFISDATLGDDGGQALTKPYGLAASNLVARTVETQPHGAAARGFIDSIVASCNENGYPEITEESVKVELGKRGMYRRLQQATVQQSVSTDLNDLPY